MQVHPEFPQLDAMLEAWREPIGADYEAYRNHLLRMLNFCFALARPDETAARKLVIAAVFHDIAIWTHGTIDYLRPSAELAREWLQQHGEPSWGDEIDAIIDQHHRFRPWREAGGDLVEAFRKADLVDVSLGLVRFGLPRAFVADVRRTFPNAGFHKRLVQLTLRQLGREPLRPLPMMKW
ncbi:HD domain-containing protein [Sinimarinibacterium flocculans]|uniref:HD domain-containing protein n=1 Tax=Sinimarinibacterium flocculans TaxID=985250 RepID=A0A318EG25_9GAMM|nr:HD domain-containing protein [Sinimarinibacterium flocculans]PXV71208.1 HD domain-containing protein [Sinimarinibacterium flocculans]